MPIIELSTEKHELQNIQNDCYEGLSDSCRVHQIRFRPGLRPDPAGGAHDAPPDPLVGWGGGHPFPIPHPLDAFGVSVSSPAATRHSAPRSQNPSEFFSGYGPDYNPKRFNRFFRHRRPVIGPDLSVFFSGPISRRIHL